MTRAATVLLLVAVGCRARTPPPPPLEVSPPGVTVTLRWTAAVDLDLYVTDPSLETAYFANPRTASGGVLEVDARCADPPRDDHSERVRWTKPPPGRYRVGVDFLETCRGRPREAPFSLTVDVDGHRQVVTGRARHAERDPRVFEFTVAAPAAGEVLR